MVRTISQHLKKRLTGPGGTAVGLFLPKSLSGSLFDACGSSKLWPALKRPDACALVKNRRILISVLWLVFGSLLRIFRNRRDLIFENFVLRQQLTVLKRRHPRPVLRQDSSRPLESARYRSAA